jgi:DNA mismatch repair protein MutS2
MAWPALDRNLAALGLDVIIEALAAKAATPGGRDALLALRPAGNIAAAQAALEETAAALFMGALRPDFSIEPCEDVTPILNAAQKQGVLRGGQLRALLPVLRTGESAAAVFKSLEDDERRKLTPIIMDIPRAAGLGEMIDESIGEDGNVKSSATAAIERLNNTVNSLRKTIRERAEKYLTDPATAPLLQDGYVTLRDNRFVLPVRAEEKSRMDGIIHGSSNSGQTYFIEPKALVDLNNRLRTAEIELEEEINRFLAELTRMVAAEADAVRAMYSAVCRLDAVMARARLASQLGLTKPYLGGALNLKGAANPLMLLERKGVVRNNLDMPQGARALVISGPNTGGKTVLLKMIGLAAAMAAMGLFIPADEGSAIPFYTRVFADIGDSQSIADGLSSFSGHILAVRRVLEKAGPESLVLLDELMINTDPKEGSALAAAALEALVGRGADVVVTTHYHELKLIAQADPLYANVSMDFDRKNARPTYRVIAGAPGESSAISVAENLDLDPAIIASARAHMQGSGERTARLLAELAGKKDALDQATFEAEKARRDAGRMRDEAQILLDAAAAKNEEISRSARTKISADARAARREIAKLMEEARGAGGSREKLTGAAKKLSAIEAQVAGAAAPEARMAAEDLKPGDEVYIIPLGGKGTVTGVPSGGRVEAMFGKMSVTLAQSEVVALGPPGGVKKAPAPWSERARAESVEEGELVEINIRGMRAEAALEEVEKKLDDAYRLRARVVMIIHGKGTGALRAAVREYLAACPYAESFRLGEPKEGGEGATVVTLR